VAKLLTGLTCVLVWSLPSAAAGAAEISDRHELRLNLDSTLVETRSGLGAWPDAGFGKLANDSDGSRPGSMRLSLDYRGQLAETLFSHVVVDALDNTENLVGITESYLEWRPLPSGPMRHRFRFGAFYPSISAENSDDGWESPYSRSFSAINAWLGEEIRPVGADWRLSRPLGGPGSRRELSAFAGAFYGNDTAGTLLFWRGWSVHNRQIRLNERLALPPLRFSGPPGGPEIVVERTLDPIAEIDDRPGFYVGTRLGLVERARIGLAFYDNRADAYAFEDGQWAWGTRFWHLSAEFSLPGDVALIGQRMRGDTDWLVPPSTDGSISPAMELVTDEFDSSFILLSREFGRHRLSLRLEQFDIRRPADIEADHGTARTLSYLFELSERLRIDAEWISIRSRRDLWPVFYAIGDTTATEKMLQLGIRLRLLNTASD